MKSTSAAPVGAAHPANHEASQEQPGVGDESTLGYLKRLCRHEETAQEAAALLLLLGSESAQRHQHGESWADTEFGTFLACGIQSLAIRAAKELQQASC